MKTTHLLLVCVTAFSIAALKYCTPFISERAREQFILALAQNAGGVHVRPGAKLEQLSYTGPDITGLPPLPTQNPDPDLPPTE